MKEKSPDTGHSFKDYFKRAVNQMLVLKLLSEKPMYGYQVTVELERRSKGRYTSNVLYPVIYKLEEQGLIKEVDKRISDKNRVQNYYGITEAGKDHLKILINEYTEMLEAVHDIMDQEESDGEDT